MDTLLEGALVGSLGLLSLTVGGTWSAIRPPGRTTRAVVQHIAAGTVFAGLTGDVLARLLQASTHPAWLVGGMLLGLAMVLSIRTIASRHRDEDGGGSLGATIIADVLTDGVLMGLAIASGSPVAIVFVIALAPELTFLGVTLSGKLGGGHWGPARRIGVPALVGLGVVAGGVLGAWARSGPAELATGIEAFGAVALAYLVVEELLREAHQEMESAWLAAMFFAGFIPFFVAAAMIS